MDATGGTPQDFQDNQQTCAAQGGTFAAAPCSHAGAVGGCRATHAGAAVTTWYYAAAGATPDDVRKICTGLASTGLPDTTIEFVPP